MRGLKIAGLITGSILMSFTSSFAQTGWKTEKYKITISGTSTLHDWHIEVKSLKVDGLVVNENNGIQISNGRVVVPVNSLESGNGLMNSKTYKALRYEKYPNIEFSLKQVIFNLSNQNSSCVCEFQGNLMIGGVKRDVKIPANCELQKNVITISGNYKLNIRDYMVEPPTAMMGTLKTGEMVTIDFFIQLKKD